MTRDGFDGPIYCRGVQIKNTIHSSRIIMSTKTITTIETKSITANLLNRQLLTQLQATERQLYLATRALNKYINTDIPIVSHHYTAHLRITPITHL